MRFFKKRRQKINEYSLTVYTGSQKGGEASCIDITLYATGFHISGYGRVYEFIDEFDKVIAIYPTSMTAISDIAYDVDP